MITVSDVTGMTYDDKEGKFYRNVIQSAWMLSHPDVILLDLFTDSKGKLVFVFSADSHNKYIKEWAERNTDG